MTSLKKPLIAIASALALAATTFVVPANATVSAAVTVDGTDVATTAKVITTPAAPTVPADNKVDLEDTVKFVVTVANNTTVTATATNARLVSALHTSGSPVTASAGASSISGNSGSGTTVTFYAFTTKATTGSVVVSTGGSSVTYYLKGEVGPAYNLSVVAPKVANISGTVKVLATVTDVFGNAITDATISNTVIRGTLGSFSYDDTDKVYEATFTAPATAGNAIVESKVSATAVTGLATPDNSVVYTIAVGDLASQNAVLSAKVTELEAKIAELEAKLAAAEKKAVTNRKKHNVLAMKWNKKFPGEKVELISSK